MTRVAIDSSDLIVTYPVGVKGRGFMWECRVCEDVGHGDSDTIAHDGGVNHLMVVHQAVLLP